MPARAQRLRLLAAAAEDERVAALEPHDRRARRARARRSSAFVSSWGTCSPPPILPTSTSSRVGARVVERLGRDQPVVEDDVGAARCSSSARAVSRPGIARARRRRGTTVAGAQRPRLRAARAAAAAATRSAPRRAPRGPCAVDARRAPTRAVGQRRRTRAAQRPRRRACAWAPTGVSQSRRARATSARSAPARASPARRRSPRRGPRASPVAGLERRRPGPAAGTSSVQQRADLVVAARGASQPGGGEHDRVALAVGELAQPRVDVAAQLDDLEVGAQRAAAARGGAATPCRRGRPSASASSERAPHSASRASARGGTAASSRPSGSCGRARPWPSARRGRSRRAAARARARATQRALSAAVAAPRSPRRHDRRRARASPPQQRRRPGAPAPAPARCRACRSSRRSALERADVVGRRRSGAASSGGVGASARLVEPEQLAQRAACACAVPRSASFRRSVGSCSRRCMTARAIASTRARSRGDARLPAARRSRPAPGRRSPSPCSRSAAIVGSTSSWPSQRAKRWISSSTIASARAPRPRARSRLRATTACRSSMS